jgi:hypothetical protein
MISKTVKEVQHELISYNWEERALCFIATFISVGLLLSVAFLIIKLWG